MKCKYCSKEIKNDFSCVTYKSSITKGSSQCYEGMYQCYEEIPVDGGVFCCDICLMDYLKHKGSVK